MDSLLSVVIMGLASSEPWPEMLRTVSFPVRSFQFLMRGSSQLHLELLLPSNRLGVAAGAPRLSDHPHPGLWQCEDWQCLFPHLYSILTGGDKAALMGLNWSC